MNFSHVFLFLLLVRLVRCHTNGDLVLVQDVTDVDDDKSAESNEQHKSKQSKIFIASNEWQQIDDDHVLPKGLHVRINLETGKKEAKLLENSAEEVDARSHITSNYVMVGNADTNQAILPENVRTLQELNNFKDISQKHSLKQSKNFDDLNIKFKSEGELLKTVLQKYKTEIDETNRLRYLADLEYYVHSIDLANDLFQLGGFRHLFQDLNQTSVTLQMASLNVIGATIQNNQKLKNELLEADFLRHIVVQLKKAKQFSILKKCFFVLSAFLRNFAVAQKSFFYSYGGIDILQSLLSKNCVLGIRVSMLLSDLVAESSISSTTSKTDLSEQKANDEIQYESMIQKSQICFKLILLMRDLNERELDMSSLFESMFGLINACNAEFRANINLFQQIFAENKNSNDDFASTYLKKLLFRLKSKEEL